MQSKTTEADLAFREEVRDFLNASLTEDLREAGRKKTSIWQEPESAAAWQKILYNKGWLVPEWPVEYGGTDWSLTQHYIFAQECARFDVPGISPMGLRMCGPMLIGHGTEAQKAYYLPRILSGEHIWCQGYSEPGAGSDLASLKTSAIADGDDYIVNGTKIWTSFAQHANMIFALVRTSTEGKVQQGISFLLIDMSHPGHHGKTHHQSGRQPRAKPGVLRQRAGPQGQPHRTRKQWLVGCKIPAPVRAILHVFHRASPAVNPSAIHG